MQRVVYLDLKSIFARFFRASSEFLKYKKQTVRYRVNLLVISHACSRPVVGTERIQIAITTAKFFNAIDLSQAASSIKFPPQ